MAHGAKPANSEILSSLRRSLLQHRTTGMNIANRLAHYRSTTSRREGEEDLFLLTANNVGHCIWQRSAHASPQHLLNATIMDVVTLM